MPLTKIPFKPGINKEVTQYANEGGYYDCNLVRFRMGYAQKIGGWANTNYAANHESPSSFTFNGVTHSMTNWITAKSENLIGFGTTQGFFVQNGIGTQYHDITPISKVASLPAGSLVTTVAGSPVITVNSPNNNLDIGTIVYFAPATGTTTSTTVDGVTIYFGNQIDGTYAYSVINVIKDSSQVEVTATGSGSVATLTGTFTIVPPPGTSITVSNMSIDGYNGVYNVITSSGTTLTYANTTTGSGVGGTVVWPTDSFQVIGTGAATVGGVAGGIALSATYLVNSGNSTTEANYAWGIGTWGLGLWGLGQPTYTTYNNRLWSQASFGDDLIFSIPGKPIYYWVKSTVNWTPAITLAQYAGTQNYQSVTTTSEAINTTTFTVEFNDYVYPGEVISFNSASPTTGSIPTGTTVLSIVGLVVTVSNPVTIPSGSILNLSYSGLYVPKQTNRLFVSPVYQFVIALGSNPYDPANANSAFNPLLVRWSDQTVPEQWIPLTSNQSGEQSLGNGSTLVTAINNLQIILVYTDTAVYQMQYVGAPYVFSFTLLQENISIISPNAAITANNVSWWMGIDKFYIYNGTVQVLPSTLRRYVFSNINKEQQWQVVAGYNEGFSEIWWFYPSTNSTVNDSYVKFNFIDNVWDYGSLTRTAWLGTSLQAYPMGAYSTQITYLTANITSSQTSITVANAASYKNSGTLVIGTELIAYTGISGNTFTGCTRGAYGSITATATAYTPVMDVEPNQIMFHEYGIDVHTIPGVTLPVVSYIQSSDVEIGDGHHFASVWRIVPDLTFINSVSDNPQTTLTVIPRLNPGSPYQQGVDQPTVKNVRNYGPAPQYPIEQFTGQVYTRIRGRQLAFRVDTGNLANPNMIYGFPTSALGVMWQLGNMRLDIRPDGRR